MTIPNLKKRDLTQEALGFAPRNFVKPPVLYMNYKTLDKATFFGLQIAKGVKEITMFTSIKLKYFTDIIELGRVYDHAKEKVDAFTKYKGPLFAKARKRRKLTN